MKASEIKNHEFYEAPIAEFYDLEVALVYMENGGGSGEGDDIEGSDWG